MRFRKRAEQPVSDDGQAHCTYCGQDVVVDPNGHCDLGHRVTTPEMAAAAVAGEPAPEDSSETGPEIHPEPAVPDTTAAIAWDDTEQERAPVAPPAPPVAEAESENPKHSESALHDLMDFQGVGNRAR